MIIIYMKILKYDKNELIHKIETDSETQETTCDYQRGKRGKDKLGVWDQQKYNTINIYKIDKQ